MFRPSLVSRVPTLPSPRAPFLQSRSIGFLKKLWSGRGKEAVEAEKVAAKVAAAAKPLPVLSPYKFYEDKRRAISTMEKEMQFPVRIVGTRKPAQFRFWAYDTSFALLVRQVFDPVLYLTFEDTAGRRFGPVRYNSRMVGTGLKIDIALRFQFGDASGLRNVSLPELPKRIEVEGGEIGLGAGSFFTTHAMRLKVADTSTNALIHLSPEKLGPKMPRIWYYGVSAIGNYGFMTIDKGYYEAEPFLSPIGYPPQVERFLGVLVGLVIVLGLFVTVAPILIMTGYINLGTGFPPQR